ncbi:Protein CBG24395 [Caenorhabditis briggsae]|uniref:Protein CBG24395 n=1 Tax=Caenorhabditis briggsae TaxID=6238 RepID=H8WH21_CAEBR|nr:Protein CBG24395 [Caenorhabditis briggsae]CCG58588.1 Protein CBG24395 [Caenorhabditis briggsae]
MANEFLRQQANTMAPTSFSMKSMQRNLPQTSASSMAMNWSQEFQPRQNQLATQWTQQYTAGTTSQGMESAWRQAMPLSSASIAHPQDSGMWSSEYLDTVDTSLQQGSNAWADDFLGNQDPMEKVWDGQQAFEQRWEEIKRDMEKEETIQNVAGYVYQVCFIFVNWAGVKAAQVEAAAGLGSSREWVTMESISSQPCREHNSVQTLNMA